MTTSVCLALHNGSAFVRDQVASIIRQLSDRDELVVVDDASSDDSVRILEKFRDSRIRIIQQARNCGVLRTFERALNEVKGDVIFLSDQDDVWREDKVQKTLRHLALRPDVSLVLSDGAVIDASGRITSESWIRHEPFYPGIFHNLIRNRYLGCAMAFRRSLLNYVLPFPADTPMHDMWIGMVNQLFGKAYFIEEPLIYYRRHGNNMTTGRHASLQQMLKWRIALIRNLAGVYLRSRRLPASKRQIWGN